MKFDQMKTSTFRKKDLVAPIIIVVLLSLAMGLIVFYISDPFFNKEETPTYKELELTDNNVRILYDYVSYSIDGERNDIFVTNEMITKDNIPNKDKLYYALQFANPEDYKSTGKRDKDNNQIFNISDEKIDTYMKRFFGSQITYKKEKEYEYTMDLSEDVKYIASLTYSSENKGYDTTLTKVVQEDEEDKVFVKPFYTKLVKAILHDDQTIELQEKIIYTKVIKTDKLYSIKVYKDYNLQQEVETRNNLTESQMKNSVFNLNEYMDNASTVTYKFKTEDGKYYFYSSEVTNN